MRSSATIAFFFLCISTVLITQSCHHAPTIPDKQVSFSADIVPIMGGNCQASGCHGLNDGEFPLVTYEDLVKHGRIVPFKPYQSSIYQTVVSRQPGYVMPVPPAAPLTETQIETLFIWIEQGALNN